MNMTDSIDSIFGIQSETERLYLEMVKPRTPIIYSNPLESIVESVAGWNYEQNIIY